MTARFIVADVFDGLATLGTGSVDLVVTSPPFLALRSYLPSDHPDKSKEIGSESTPAEFIDTLLKVTAELRRVLAPHGSICVELGDTYAGSGGAGGDYGLEGWRAGQPGASGSMKHERVHKVDGRGPFRDEWDGKKQGGGPGWPLAKSRTLIPSLYQIALAYGFNPLTGQPSPAGQWRVRNIVTWARPNPPVGALGDKWRPATSDLIVACTSSKRYWDDLATRREFQQSTQDRMKNGGYVRTLREGVTDNTQAPRIDTFTEHAAGGAPLLDYWVIPPTGYTGAHYAVFPSELVEPCVKAMCPPRVCVTCGEPSRRILGEATYEPSATYRGGSLVADSHRLGEGVNQWVGPNGAQASVVKQQDTLGWSDCGHNTWRPGLILDPFAGSGTTLSVATGHGHDAIGIDLDHRNLTLARDRVGPFLFEEVEIGELQPGSGG